MKKLSFALACAASVAVFADGLTNAIGFEYYQNLPFTGLSGKLDNGTAGGGPTDSYWLYEGTGDGSTVKAYGGDNLAAYPNSGSVSGEAGNNYLELSTEGGTLWRSINTLEDATTLGTAQNIGATGIFVDTMVQFTPTEDGGTPEIGQGDKLAIWLNVDSSGATPVTNLCVRASLVEDDGFESTCTPTTFVLNTANPIQAGTWYRLTVKTIADVDQRMAKNPEGYNTGLTGFQIFLDGTLLSSTTASFASSYLDLATDANSEYSWLDQSTDAALITLLESGSVFASLTKFETECTLQAVGFKGSGAIDELVFSDSDPTSANVGWPQDPTTVAGQTAAVKFGLTGDMAGEDAAKVATWAKANGVAYADRGSINTTAYLLNCAPADVETETAAFQITSIEQDGDGDWVVEVTGEKTDGDAYGNGKIEIRGSTTLNGTYTVNCENAKFFKAFLVFAGIPAAE